MLEDIRVAALFLRAPRAKRVFPNWLEPTWLFCLFACVPNSSVLTGLFLAHMSYWEWGMSHDLDATEKIMCNTIWRAKAFLKQSRLQTPAEWGSPCEQVTVPTPYTAPVSCPLLWGDEKATSLLWWSPQAHTPPSNGHKSATQIQMEGCSAKYLASPPYMCRSEKTRKDSKPAIHWRWPGRHGDCRRVGS